MTTDRESRTSRSPLGGSLVEEQLFSHMVRGDTSSAKQLLTSLLIQVQNRRKCPSTTETELCLPIGIAIEGFQLWSQRRKLLGERNPLKPFLRHVRGTVPFYKSVRGPARKSADHLESFPLVEKRDILSSYPAFISSAYASQSRKYFKITSGYGGDPLTVWYDLPGFYDVCYDTYRVVARVVPQLAETIQLGGLAAVQVTDDPLTWNARTVLPSLKLALLRRRSLGQNDQADRETIKELRRLAIPLLCGLPTSLNHVREMDAAYPGSKKRIAPLAIFVSGENLFNDTRASIEEWFRCQVYNGYASSEGGLVGIECFYRQGLHVREDRVRVEILTDGGKLAPEGTGELVLTNFMNWAMPFVRYRTGDHATVQVRECPCGFAGATVVDLPGRESVRFGTLAQAFDPRQLDALFASLPIKQFKLTQKNPTDYTFAWVPIGDCPNPRKVEVRVAAAIYAKAKSAKVDFQRVKTLSVPGRKVRRYQQEP